MVFFNTKGENPGVFFSTPTGHALYAVLMLFAIYNGGYERRDAQEEVREVAR